jgi:hypothetical protein
MNIEAYKELIERKNEEIMSLQEQMGRMRGGNFSSTSQAIRQQDIQFDNPNGVPMCGTNKECRIF